MKNINFVCIIGTLVREVKTFEVGGHKKTTFTIKERQVYNEKEQIEYIPCIAWNKLGEIAEKIKVDQIVTITGKIKTDSYEKDGKKEYKTYVGVESVTPGIVL